MSKGKSTTTTTTDPAQMEIYQDLYSKAQGIASQPFVPYTGARVAGFNPDQLAGFDATRGMFNQSMGFDPRNQLNNLANMSAPSVNLPFGYNQPQQPSPIFQPMPITGGGGGRPTPPPSIGGPGGGGPVFTSPNPTTNMNIETRDTEFGPVTISSPGFSGGGGVLNNNLASSINFQNDKRFGQPITTRIGRNGQEIPVYGFHNNVPGGGGIDYGSMGGGLFSGGPVALPGGQLPQAEKDFQNLSIEDRLKIAKDRGIEINLPKMDNRLPGPRVNPGLANPRPGVTVPRPDPIQRPMPVPGPGLLNPPQSQTNPFSPTQLGPAAMQQAATVRPVERFGGANITQLANFGGANIDPVERFGAANISPVDLYSGASVNRGDVRDVTPRSLLDTDLGAYQNPFQSQVIDNTLDDLNRARQLQIQSDQDAAIGRGAFGGSRSALLESETNRNFAEQAARTAGDLRAQGFDRATNLAGQDIGRSFDASRFMAGIDKDIASQNAGFGQQAGIAAQGLLGDIVRDQARLNQQAGLAGMDAENRRRFQEGMFRQEAGINDANTFNRAAMQNAGFAQEAGMANMAAKNRFGLTQAELDANRFAANQNASNTFGLRQGDFDNAMNMGMFDAANRAAFMQPELDMRNRQFQAGLLGGQLSDQYRSLGLLSGIGSQQQGLGQAGLDAGYNEFLRALGYGPQQLGLLAQGVSALPGDKAITDQYKPGTVEQVGNAAGAIGSLMALFSDERLKDNITLVGKSKGHNVYTWTWNDVAKKLGINTPEIGVIAQEVAHIPNAVFEHESGYLTVNYGAL